MKRAAPQVTSLPNPSCKFYELWEEHGKAWPLTTFTEQMLHGPYLEKHCFIVLCSLNFSELHYLELLAFMILLCIFTKKSPYHWCGYCITEDMQHISKSISARNKMWKPPLHTVSNFQQNERWESPKYVASRNSYVPTLLRQSFNVGSF